MISCPADRREVSDRDDGDGPALPVDPGTAYRAEADQLAREAQAYYARKRYAVAEERVHRLLALQERTLGRVHPEYATGLSMLGELRFLQGDRDGAEPLIREAVEVRRKALGELHPDHAVGLCCLAGLLGRVGRLDEAETHLRRALAIRRETMGEDHPDTIRNGQELERLLARRGETEEADDRAEPVREAAPVEPEPGTRSRFSLISPAQPAPPPRPSPTRGEEGIEALPPCGGGWGGARENSGTTRSTGLVESTPASTARFDPAEPSLTSPIGMGVVATSEFMPGGEGSNAFSREMVAISYAFDDLRSRIVDTVRKLDAPGGPPPDGVLDELDACRRDLQSLRDRVRRRAPELQAGHPPFEALDSLRDIAALLDVVREAERRRASRRATSERALPREMLIDLARLNPIALPPSGRPAMAIPPVPRSRTFGTLDQALEATVQPIDVPTEIAVSHPAPPLGDDHASLAKLAFAPTRRSFEAPSACTRHFGKGVISGPLVRGWRLR